VEVILNPKHFFSQFFYSNSNGYSVEKMEKDKLVLLNIMDNDRPYLDPSLSLDKLAHQTEMNPKYLSLILNNTLNKNFYEFINEYRIEEVKELLIDPELKHLTIAGIANEAGFNSKSSFNSIFKKQTNITPKEFLKQHADSRVD
jgi:AraC-like DNA-binding protein